MTYQLVFIEILKVEKNNWLKIKTIKEIIMLEFIWKVFLFLQSIRKKVHLAEHEKLQYNETVIILY